MATQEEDWLTLKHSILKTVRIESSKLSENACLDFSQRFSPRQLECPFSFHKTSKMNEQMMIVNTIHKSVRHVCIAYTSHA